MTQQPDMFGFQKPQGDLFGEDLRAWAPAPVDAEKVRLRLRTMLDDLRSVREGSPWPHDTMRANRLLFPQMSNWLPEPERDQFRFEFEAELKRLAIAA
jgi:hypothetical protein